MNYTDSQIQIYVFIKTNDETLLIKTDKIVPMKM